MGESLGATLLISAQLHRRLAPLFLNFWAPFFLFFFIIHPRNFFKNQIDVEFDFSIGHVLVLFTFVLNNKQKM